MTARSENVGVCEGEYELHKLVSVCVCVRTSEAAAIS